MQDTGGAAGEAVAAPEEEAQQEDLVLFNLEKRFSAASAELIHSLYAKAEGQPAAVADLLRQQGYEVGMTHVSDKACDRHLLFVLPAAPCASLSSLLFLLFLSALFLFSALNLYSLLFICIFDLHVLIPQ